MSKVFNYVATCYHKRQNPVKLSHQWVPVGHWCGTSWMRSENVTKIVNGVNWLLLFDVLFMVLFTMLWCPESNIHPWPHRLLRVCYTWSLPRRKTTNVALYQRRMCNTADVTLHHWHTITLLVFNLPYIVEKTAHTTATKKIFLHQLKLTTYRKKQDFKIILHLTVCLI